MRRGALLVVVGLAAVLSLLVTTGTAWAAANWTVNVAASSSGEAKAQALPVAPTATSACTAPASSKKVTVTWAAITHASGYGVYQSNTTATGTYTLQTTVTTLTWTSAALATGNYWYEVVANIGPNWASAKSAATAQRTISISTCS
jgi:hypothetical protein